MNPLQPSQGSKLSIASGGNSSNVMDTVPTADSPVVVFPSPSVLSHWDPLRSPDWDSVKPQSATLIRIKKDIMEIYRDPPPGVVVLPNPDDITRIYAIITGPFDTPYEGGYFLFLIRCPPDYPIKSPRVRLLTTGNQSVRFNPNFYKNGKVCLSILGTWSGPGWSPAQSLASVLVSIQSLMNENPYHNEPGFSNERVAGDSKRYADCIRHETIRVAVCDMVEHGSLFCKQAKEIVESSFLEYYDYYITTCTENMKDDGKPLEDPFGCNKGHYAYKDLRTRIESLKLRLDSRSEASNGETSASNSSS